MVSRPATRARNIRFLLLVVCTLCGLVYLQRARSTDSKSTSTLTRQSFRVRCLPLFTSFCKAIWSTLWLVSVRLSNTDSLNEYTNICCGICRRTAWVPLPVQLDGSHQHQVTLYFVRSFLWMSSFKACCCLRMLKSGVVTYLEYFAWQFLMQAVYLSQCQCLCFRRQNNCTSLFPALSSLAASLEIASRGL